MRCERIAPAAKPLLRLVVGRLRVGQLLAATSGEKIVYPLFSMHALQHRGGAFGFIVPWAFDGVRFAEAAQHERIAR